MNTVTIHPPKAKPLTFADIPCGPFIWGDQEYVKVMDSRDVYCNAVRRQNGERYSMPPNTIVTLPDAPPPQDDTVTYGDLTGREMFEFVEHPPGEVWIKGRTDGGAVLCLNPATGRIMSMPETARVRRVHSVTITQGSETK